MLTLHQSIMTCYFAIFQVDCQYWYKRVHIGKTSKIKLRKDEFTYLSAVSIERFCYFKDGWCSAL